MLFRSTYTISGERGSGVICLNGAAARRVQPGDTVIIIAYCMIDATEAKSFKPNVVILDANNAIVDADYIEKHGEIK